MKIARGICNVLTILSILAMIICLIIAKNILLIFFFISAIIFLSISDKISQTQKTNEMQNICNDKAIEVQIKESSNPIWKEVRKQANFYMRIDGNYAVIKAVIGEKEIETEPIPLADIEQYITIG